MSSLCLEPKRSKEDAKDAFFVFLRKGRMLNDEELDLLIDLCLGSELDELVNSLSSKGKLTPYQIKCIREGRSRDLIIGPYTILEELGEGGFGKVYKSFHQLMHRTVALKVIAPRLIESTAIRELFLREVIATTRLVHANIASAYDANDENGQLYLALEYINGLNLEAWIKKNGPLNPTEACQVVSQVAEALQYTHERGMLHRDVKPNNILIESIENQSQIHPLDAKSGLGTIKVIDFGLARLNPWGTSQSGTIRQEAELVGTPEFMSPEQARDFHDVDIRSDLYSLGCTFYYALAGRVPFKGSTHVNTIAMHLNDEPQRLVELRPDVPLRVVNIIRRLMAKEPNDRFQTPADLVVALHDALVEFANGRTAEIQRQIDKLVCAATEIPRTDLVPIECLPDQSASNTLSLASAVAETDHVAQIETYPTEDRASALWKEWVTIVELLASGRPSGRSELEYAAIHCALLRALRKPPEFLSASISQLYPRLESLVEPWVMLRAFRDLDRRSLQGLMETCLRYDPELPVHSTSTRPKWTGAIVVLIEIAVVCIGAVLIWRHDLLRILGR